MSKVLARLSAHKQGGNKEQNRAPSPKTAVEVDRDENTPRGIGDAQPDRSGALECVLPSEYCYDGRLRSADGVNLDVLPVRD